MASTTGVDFWPPNEGCLSGHHWAGSSQCQWCGERLRCECGCYVRADNLDAHIPKCRVYSREEPEYVGTSHDPWSVER